MVDGNQIFSTLLSNTGFSSIIILISGLVLLFGKIIGHVSLKSHSKLDNYFWGATYVGFLFVSGSFVVLIFLDIDPTVRDIVVIPQAILLLLMAPLFKISLSRKASFKDKNDYSTLNRITYEIFNNLYVLMIIAAANIALVAYAMLNITSIYSNILSVSIATLSLSILAVILALKYKSKIHADIYIEGEEKPKTGILWSRGRFVELLTPEDEKDLVINSDKIEYIEYSEED